MILHHGTNAAFDRIDLAKGLPGKDFGQGFYTSDSFECARKTALQRVDRLGGAPVVLHLDFPDAHPSDLRVKQFSAPSREWALFVRANRRAYVEADDHNRDGRYDVVIGPIANDKLSLQFRLFDKGIITLDAFVDALKFRELYFQYSFHTQRAISHLRLLGWKMSAEVKQLIEFAVQDLVAEIVAREGLTIKEAMDALYHSPFFAKLTDPATGLYRESGEYLFAAMHEPTHSTATRT